MSLYVLHFSNELQNKSTRKEFFYHTDILIKKVSNLYRRKIKIIDIFTEKDFNSKVLTDKNAVVFFIKNQIVITDFCKNVITKCSENNIPIILKDNFSNKSYASARVNSVSGDMPEKANAILSYCFSNKRNRLAIYAVNPYSEVDVSLAEELYKRYPEITEDDIYVKSNGLEDGLSECFDNFYKNRERYDTVIAVNDLSAIDLLERLKKTDPDYIDKTFFIGTMDSILSRLYSPSLTSTSYDQNSAAKMLYKIYELCIKHGNDFHNINIKLKNYFVARNTTADIPFGQSFTNFRTEKRKLILDVDSENLFLDENAPIVPIMLESMLTSIDMTDFQIIYMLMQNKSIMDISDDLFLSISSVKHRISNMYKFLGVNRKKDFMNIISDYINRQNLLNYIKEQNTYLNG